jgi:hypothetical protein
MQDILDSEKPCGTDGNKQLWSFDGNLDGVIDQLDLEVLTDFSRSGTPFSSWYDITVDGWTLLNEELDSDNMLHYSDYLLVQAKVGTDCAAE